MLPSWSKTCKVRIVIFGCGSLTTALLSSQRLNGHDVTLIGSDLDYLDEAADGHQVAVIGITDPQMQDWLHLGNIDHAEMFLALTEDDHQNLLAAQTAKSIFNVGRVVCRVDAPPLQQLYASLGMEVISPTLDLLHDLDQDL